MVQDVHDGWLMLHAVCMRDGDGMAWVNGDRQFDEIFRWGWMGWDVFLICVKRLKKNFAHLRKYCIFAPLT